MSDVEWAVREPRPGLRSVITRYVGYRQHGPIPPIHRGLPSRHVTLAISLTEPITYARMPRPDQSPGRFAAAVGGLHTAPVLIAQDVRREPARAGIHVEIDPLGVPALFDVPAAALSGLVVDLGELGPGDLPERLAQAPDWASRFDLLDRVLGGALSDHTPSPEIAWAWRRLTGAGGLVRVGDLAREIGWSRRHFGERFRHEVGLPPKQAARVVRFDRAAARLRTRPADLSGLAAECGFYDQAHLSNEWRALAGCSPRAWIAEESLGAAR